MKKPESAINNALQEEEHKSDYQRNNQSWANRLLFWAQIFVFVFQKILLAAQRGANNKVNV